MVSLLIKANLLSSNSYVALAALKGIIKPPTPCFPYLKKILRGIFLALQGFEVY